MSVSGASETRLKPRLLWVTAAGACVLGFAMLAPGSLPDMPGNASLRPVMAAMPVQRPDGSEIFVQKYEVTVAEWNRCFDAGACGLQLKPRPGQDAETTPATGVSFLDVSEYVAWLNEASGYNFRLPTMDEWRHMAQEVMPEEPDPIFTDPALTWASAYLLESASARALKPSGTFPETREGIADLSGSVWEWTQDCYTPDVGSDRCPAFYVGGEHLAVIPYPVRDPARGGCAVGSPPPHLGLRVVSDSPFT